MKPPNPFGRLTDHLPTCLCSYCLKYRESHRKHKGDPMENAGRVQHGALEKGWSDGGTDYGRDGYKFGHMRRIEVADREEREAYGKPLTAGYRHIIGPTPKLRAGDTEGAKLFLWKIERAIDQGMWTRSEWRRLYTMRDKWKRRAAGTDARFTEVGNKSGALDKSITDRVADRNVVLGILETLHVSSKRRR